MTHTCVGNLTIFGSNDGLSPGWRQAIISTNAGILLTGPLGTHVSENLIEILTSSFKKMRLKVSSAKWRPFCLGLYVLNLTKSCLSTATSVTAVCYLIQRTTVWLPCAVQSFKWSDNCKRIKCFWNLSLTHFQMHFPEWKCMNFV